MDDDALAAWGWVLWFTTGHEETCTGWTFDLQDRQIVCSCGAPLWELDVLAGLGAVA